MDTKLREKILSSGLVDKHTAQVLERWGHLQPGEIEKVNEEALKNATQDQLAKLAEDIASVVEKDHIIRETNLDLKRMKWHVDISIYKNVDIPGRGIGPARQPIAERLPALIDNLGRYFFRVQDIDPQWFVPGFIIERRLPPTRGMTYGTIVESTTLYSGEEPIAFQVSVTPR